MHLLKDTRRAALSVCDARCKLLLRGTHCPPSPQTNKPFTVISESRQRYVYSVNSGRTGV
ncbi:hypothetical protein J6590_099498 [Homalodisca vitripennis]|nr:hypothetical protein J6590_099498 [Homalodisca vitripennis]